MHIASFSLGGLRQATHGLPRAGGLRTYLGWPRSKFTPMRGPRPSAPYVEYSKEAQPNTSPVLRPTATLHTCGNRRQAAQKPRILPGPARGAVPRFAQTLHTAAQPARARARRGAAVCSDAPYSGAACCGMRSGQRRGHAFGAIIHNRFYRARTCERCRGRLAW